MFILNSSVLGNTNTWGAMENGVMVTNSVVVAEEARANLHHTSWRKAQRTGPLVCDANALVLSLLFLFRHPLLS